MPGKRRLADDSDVPPTPTRHSARIRQRVVPDAAPTSVRATRREPATPIAEAPELSSAAEAAAEARSHRGTDATVAPSDAAAYDALLDSIFSAFSRGTTDANHEMDEADVLEDGDSDSDSAEAGDVRGLNAAGEIEDDGGNNTRGGSESDEDEGHAEAGGSGAGALRQGVGVGVLAWRPDIAMPQALSAEAAPGMALPAKERCLSKAVMVPPRDPRKAAREAAKKRQDTAGGGWFDMKAQQITDQVRQDWRLLRLRSAYSPRHFYKSFDSTKIPKYFQMGEIVEGTGEFYSGRMTKKERKSTLADELLADIALKRERQRRYAKMQAASTQWSKQRKKNHPKIKRSAHRKKH